MKVLYITNIPAPYKVEFFNRLSKQCDLTVVYERKTASDREKDWKTLEEVNFTEIYLNGINYSNDSSISLELIRFLKKTSFDVIIFGVYHTLTAMMTMQYLSIIGKKFILSSDGGFVKKESNLKKWVKTHFIKLASWYLSPGGMTDSYLEYYGASKASIYRYSFTSVAEEDICLPNDKISLRQRIGLKGNINILSVGQLIPRKGFDLLFKALSKLPDESIHLYVVGGKPTEEYNSMVKKLKLEDRVHFVGFLNKEDLKQYYLAADLMCLPTREDVWGLVVLEALACGLPVISTNKCNAAIELIKNSVNGYVVESEDSDAIASAIQKIIQSDISFMQRNAYETAKKNTYSQMVKAHMNLISKVGE